MKNRLKCKIKNTQKVEKENPQVPWGFSKNYEKLFREESLDDIRCCLHSSDRFW